MTNPSNKGSNSTKGGVGIAPKQQTPPPPKINQPVLPEEKPFLPPPPDSGYEQGPSSLDNEVDPESFPKSFQSQRPAHEYSSQEMSNSTAGRLKTMIIEALDEQEDPRGLYPIPAQKGTVIFRKVGMIIDPNPKNNGRPLAPVIENVPTRDRILNKRGQLVELKYSTGQIYTSDGKLVDKYEEIWLEKGLIIVTPYEPDLYEYLMRSNFNRSNPNRNPNSPYIYELEDNAAVKAKEMEKFSREMNVLTEFNAIRDGAKVMAFARALRVNTDQDMTSIRHDIVVLLKKNPAFWDEFYNPQTTVKSMVIEALAMNILIYKPEQFAIGYIEDTTKQFKAIRNLPQNMSQADVDAYFARWLMEEDKSGWIDYIQTRIKNAKGWKDEY